MKKHKKLLFVFALSLSLMALLSSCRANRCGGCPTFSISANS
ncbi:hypothetical protein [Saprospira grandis]|uniref:Lipoprotein n=1 Tax=Saprospira grandis (strain Lewin) TaxID=984262 RepID=H6L3I9_SAPGL|nr:hypothetical protein [Saprospira grandis]AFC24937.1 hypothetical protein SGRA_2208 [Saprospira grandis str. Lewin]